MKSYIFNNNQLGLEKINQSHIEAFDWFHLPTLTSNQFVMLTIKLSHMLQYSPESNPWILLNLYEMRSTLNNDQKLHQSWIQIHHLWCQFHHKFMWILPQFIWQTHTRVTSVTFWCLLWIKPPEFPPSPLSYTSPIMSASPYIHVNTSSIHLADSTKVPFLPPSDVSSDSNNHYLTDKPHCSSHHQELVPQYDVASSQIIQWARSHLQGCQCFGSHPFKNKK